MKTVFTIALLVFLTAFATVSSASFTAQIKTGTAGGIVRAIALQPDGRILAGGWFDGANGLPRTGIVRFHQDGSLDTGFNVTFDSGSDDVYAIALQPDGKILIGGSFGSVNNTPAFSVARLNRDGTLDSTFVFEAAGTTRRIAVLPNGKILVAGNMTGINYDPSKPEISFIARLESNGSTDAGFTPPFSQADIHAIEPLSNGQVLVGGNFDQYMVRLNENGSLDSSFTPGGFGVTPGYTVYDIKVLPDSAILAAGNFQISSQAVTEATGVVKLEANGNLKQAFDRTPFLDQTTHALALQQDGRVLVGSAGAGGYIVRLDSYGVLDGSFSPPVINGTVEALAVQNHDGKVLYGGTMEIPAYGIGRLTATGAMDTTVMHKLTAATAGNGTGIVTSDIPGIACVSGNLYDCSAFYDDGTTVILATATGGGSTFDGWSGRCNGFSPCHAAMTADAGVSALFNPGSPLAMIAATGFANVGNAYGAAGADATIKAVGGIHPTATLSMNSSNKNIFLQGGYDSAFLSPLSGSPTVLQGLLSVSGGRLRVDNIKIR